MISLSSPMSRNTCGWSYGGVAPTHMNSLAPISITGTPGSLWKWGTTCSAIETPRVSRLVEQRNFGRHHSETGRRCLAHSQISAIGAVETPWFAGTDATIGLCGDGPLEQPAKIRAPRIGPALAAVLLLA